MKKNILLLLTINLLDAKTKEKELVDKSDISNLIRNSDLNKKLSTLGTKTELKAEQDKIVKLQAFDLSYFHGKSYFEDDGAQNYLVFQAVSR